MKKGTAIITAEKNKSTERIWAVRSEWDYAGL